MTKRVKLPKEGIDETGLRGRLVDEPGLRSRLVDETDIEGHGLPTTAPPDSLIRRGPGNGGEFARQQPDDDDVEGQS